MNSHIIDLVQYSLIFIPVLKRDPLQLICNFNKGQIYGTVSVNVKATRNIL
jgi:hypothetical protein